LQFSAAGITSTVADISSTVADIVNVEFDATPAFLYLYSSSATWKLDI
jgi:hypothetical protein